MHPIDWVIIGVFFVLLIGIAISTRRITRSVSGFLSAERCAGRYLLTISTAMAFCSAIGTIGGFEAFYRQGLSGQFWGGIMAPVWMIVSLSGFVIYRYRSTRVLTMAQFLEVRYSRRFRVFAGSVAFLSGALNCAVFPLVTTTFAMHFLRLPDSFSIAGIPIPTFQFVMFILVGSSVTLAIAGGQITIMVTDFFAGFITNIAIIASVIFVIDRLGWWTIIDTLAVSDQVDVTATPEFIEGYERQGEISLLNPFKFAGLKDFGVLYFLFTTFLAVMQTGVWQGGQGYQTSARSPHEARMAGILGGLRWSIIQTGTVLLPIAVYVVMWNPQFADVREAIGPTIRETGHAATQSQMFVPLMLSHLLPVGLIGLFAIFMIGASISTDDSYYHSWGSILLQDVVMPLRKKPFTKKEHLFWLRICIIGMGAFAYIFSSFWTLVDYIQMWFAITGTIYTGGAAAAIIGGLYWSRGTAAGAWAGMIVGGVLSLGGIVLKQFFPETVVFDRPISEINGLYIGMFSACTSIGVYILVSLLTCRQRHNMDKMLHRGAYALPDDPSAIGAGRKVGWLQRKLGVTREFSFYDKLIYYLIMSLTVFWVAVFWCVATYALVFDEGPGFWKWYWTFQQGYTILMAAACTIWFGAGGLRDVIRLYRDVSKARVNESDDGRVKGDHNLVDEVVQPEVFAPERDIETVGKS